MIAPLLRFRGGCCAWVIALVGCGYQPARTATPQDAGWCVQSASAPAAHPAAVAALQFGARDALARRGLLAACEDGTMVLEVEDVRFEPAGVVAGESHPSARATRVQVIASAMVRAPDGTRDLGVVAEDFVVATGQASMEEEHALEAGVVAAARRAGDALVRRLLGEPVPVPDP